jgi:choline dehydrogenase
LRLYNFQDAAVIDGNYLGTDHDVTAVLRAIEAARELGSRHAFDNLRESELIPGPRASAEEIEELARLASASFGHAVGTCKMGVITPFLPSSFHCFQQFRGIRFSLEVTPETTIA